MGRLTPEDLGFLFRVGTICRVSQGLPTDFYIALERLVCFPVVYFTMVSGAWYKYFRNCFIWVPSKVCFL